MSAKDFWDPDGAALPEGMCVLPEPSRAFSTQASVPSESPAFAGRLRRLLLLTLLFLGINLILGTESYLYNRAYSPEKTWLTFVIYPMPLWMPWIILVPVVLKVARRFRLDQSPGAKTIGIHLVAFVVTLGCHFLCMAALIGLQISYQNGAPPLQATLKYFGHLPLGTPLGWALRNLIVYCVVLAVSYTRDYRRELRDRDVQASRLEGQLAKAQLHSLKSQLHPHFLFNSLNAISTLMRTDMDSAERMLDMLAELLRRSLRESAVQEVPLHQEMDFVGRYLDIEQVRFSNRLNVEIDVPPEVAEALVPHLILQPLVENAIRHGIGPKVGPGTVRITARRENDYLALQVSDDGVGPGLRRSSLTGEGVGLTNTQARLDQLFGGRARMEFGAVIEGGFRVALQIPFCLAGGAVGGAVDGESKGATR
jgi:signal transduction histidine kinase